MLSTVLVYISRKYPVIKIQTCLIKTTCNISFLAITEPRPQQFWGSSSFKFNEIFM